MDNDKNIKENFVNKQVEEFNVLQQKYNSAKEKYDDEVNNIEDTNEYKIGKIINLFL